MDMDWENDPVIKAVREHSPLSRKKQDAFIICYKAILEVSIKEKEEKRRNEHELRAMRKRGRAAEQD